MVEVGILGGQYRLHEVGTYLLEGHTLDTGVEGVQQLAGVVEDSDPRLL